MIDFKEIVYNALLKRPMTTNQLAYELKESKTKIYYQVKQLQKTGHVSCETITYRDKVYSITGKKYAQVSHVHVYLNLRRLASDYAWQTKKHDTRTMQSSMSLFETA
jgi:predicted transcriptional regulator